LIPMTPHRKPSVVLQGRNPAAIRAALESFTASWSIQSILPVIGLDTEFFGGAYPDTQLTHIQLADEEGTAVVLDVGEPALLEAFVSAWREFNMHRAMYCLHYGQDDLMLLIRAGIDIECLWDSGIMANHMALLNTALKSLAQEYGIAENVMTYAGMLQLVVPPDELHKYVKAGEVIQAYDLSQIVPGTHQHQIMIDYCAQDPYLGLRVAKHMMTEVLPTLYDPYTSRILENAQFDAALLLAKHNSRGYGINEKVLLDTIDAVQADVDALDKRGRQYVRDAMGWSAPAETSALSLLNPNPTAPTPAETPKPRAPAFSPTAILEFKMDGTFKIVEA
jgi:hypothetical protein